MKIRIAPQQLQKQVLAPTMQQSIEVLLLPLLDLNIAIDQELQDNPLLEIKEDVQENIHINSEEEIKQRLLRDIAADDISYLRHFTDDDILEEKPIGTDYCLEDNLLQQLRVELNDSKEIEIGEFVIGNLDEDGYLNTTISEISEALNIENLDLIERVIKTIQAFDPIGIAARSLKECLLIQAHAIYNGEHHLVFRIINDYLPELGNKKYQEIARKTGTSIEHVKEASVHIGRLEPKPARNHRPIQSNIYIKPDIVVTKDDNNEYAISVNSEGTPPIRINSFYQNMLSRPNLSEAEREFIREKLRSGLHFIKSIEQRGSTIKKIAEYILEKQGDFFKNGHTSLVPMTLKDVAVVVNRNESTISRAINNKYIDTPKGLLPLKFFFSQGISNTHNGTAVASRSIKEEIKELIEEESKSDPLSDQEIQKHFEEKEMRIARRTISKYRQALNILPSHLRKE